MDTELFTVGHSNHTLEYFLGLLARHRIAALADVRRLPGSRKFPHFDQDDLSAALGEHEIQYLWFPSLAGRRPKRKDFVSPNQALRNQSFRNYADYMLREEFREGIEHLRTVAEQGRTVIMCSESVFWRCHRRLISDYVVAAGWTVHHIFPSGEIKPHTLTAEATVRDGQVIYPDETN